MLRVVQMGLGPIGRAIAQRMQRHAEIELVGAADPAHAGKDLGSLLGLGETGIEVDRRVDPVIDACEPAVVVQATGSFLSDVSDQLVPVLERGLHVVSTCEELAFPYYRHPELSRELDRIARKGGAVLLGTGVNPGFVMDKLVVTLMSACDSVSSVQVSRTVDASRRREPFQRKIGAGMAPSEFEELQATGRLGHIGLAESAHMVAEVIGVGKQREVREELRPVLAERRVASEFFTVEVGQVAGIHQTVSLLSDGRERVSMELQMYLGAPRPRDTVSIQGSPPLEMEIGSGVPGDEGTAAVTVNTVCLAGSLAAGLRTMLDLPLRPAGTRS